MVKDLPSNSGDVSDVGLIFALGRSPGGGQDNPFQYSCLENPMNRGAWRATVHRVAKSWTWPKRLSTHTRPFAWRGMDPGGNVVSRENWWLLGGAEEYHFVLLFVLTKVPPSHLWGSAKFLSSLERFCRTLTQAQINNLCSPGVSMASTLLPYKSLHTMAPALVWSLVPMELWGLWRLAQCPEHNRSLIDICQKKEYNKNK